MYPDLEMDVNDIDFNEIDFTIEEDNMEGDDVQSNVTPPDYEDLANEFNNEEYIPETDEVDVTNLFDAADETALLSFGDKKVSKAQVYDLVNKQEELESNHAYISSIAQDIHQAETILAEKFNRMRTETEKELEQLDLALNNPSIDKDTLYRHTQRRKQLMARWEISQREASESIDLINMAKENDFVVRRDETDRAMLIKYGKDWDGTAIYNYAISYGVPYESIKSSVNPGLADLFTKAYKYDVEQQAKQSQAKEKVKQLTSRSVSNSYRQTNRNDAGLDTKSAARQTYLQKQAKGTLTQKDNSAAFDLIDDWGKSNRR